MVTILTVIFSDSGNLTGMEHEIRISYLCTQAAREELTVDEESELLGYITLKPSGEYVRVIEREGYLQPEEYAESVNGR